MGSAEYRFGRFRLLPAERRLLDAGTPVKLGGRAFDMLLALVERRDGAVSKSDLMARVWPNLFVEENNLQVQVLALRRALGREAITTIPGRGYRFTLPIDVVEPPRPAATAIDDSRDDIRRRTNLPEQPGPLFGREADIAAVRALLAQHELVSIVGAAGIGKTRLAQSIAHALRDAFQDGVWTVELAALTEPGLLIAEVSRVLGVRVAQTGAALDHMAQSLAGRRMLLVLDNCEHLLEAVDHLVVALRSGAPGVRILVTSQELLRQPDEHVHRLGALALPEEATVSSALDSGAVQLFVARAQAVQPRFVLTDANAATIVDICRRLDGIPLAIELAAARVPLLGAEGVRERLDERFRLLTAGSRLSLRRHQTLRAALEWSCGLLSEPEEAVFERLGVFVGSFSLESAQRVGADAGMDEWAVLDHLGALVDKSLVNVEGGTTPRYRMLETTRAFALERLAARGAMPQAMRRHAEAMLQLFERAQDAVMHGSPSSRVVDQLAPDLDNLRSALRWAAEPGGDPRIAVALFGAAVAGYGFYHLVALTSEALRWSEVLRPLVDDSIPAAIAARFWLACAERGAMRSPTAATLDGHRAIALFTDLGDRLRAFRAWGQVAFTCIRAGRSDEARRALAESFALRDPSWPPWFLAVNDNHAALVLSGLGALDEARAHALAYLEAGRAAGSAVDEWNALSMLVDLDVAAGHAERAAASATEMLTQHGRQRQSDTGLSLRILATALMTAGRLDEAERVYREALSRARLTYGAATVLYDAALLVALRGRLDDAARVLAYAQGVAKVEGWHPRRVALQMRDQLLALLASERSAEALEALYEEGRNLRDDEACAIAFSAATQRTPVQT